MTAHRVADMTENNRPVVLSVATFTDVQPMDGGDTLAIRFEAPDGREVVMLIPRRAASALQTPLAEILAQTSHRVQTAQ
jgi:hypothetical protein